LIRRTKIQVKDGLTYLSNACDKSEFIRSSDPFFRAVNMNTAPDGTLFITDMYRGIIQEGNWVKEGSYLRSVIKQYALDKVAANGRIWRLAHRDFTPGPQPSMYSDSTAKLVEHLSHPNGWWRDMAQRQLVLRQDKSVVPALVKLATGATHNSLARVHAMWTLEGLDALDAPTVRRGLSAKESEVRSAAIRASETLFKKGDASLAENYVRLAADADATVAIQAMCTMRLLAVPASKSVVQNCALGKMGGAGMKEIAKMMMAPPRTWGKEFNGAQVSLLQKGDAIFGELCFACHNLDGRGTPLDGKDGVTLAPPLAGSQTVNGPKDAFIAVLLKGIGGPINGKTYESQMVPMESNNDEWIAAVGSYVRNSFGNKSSTLTKEEVAKVRKDIAARSTPWTADELRAFGPPTVANRGQWKLNASHNAASVAKAVDGVMETRYDTRTPQVPGMWVEVELPQLTEVSGIRLEHGSSGGDYPRGYLVQSSEDGSNWKDVSAGEGKAGVMEIRFDSRKLKAIRVTQTGSAKGSYWSIHELELLRPEAKTVASK
jgi:mono/diheme cytochrome c family protein